MLLALVRHRQFAAVLCTLALALVGGDSGSPPGEETALAEAVSTPTSDDELERLAAAARHAFDEGLHAKAETVARGLLSKTEAACGPQSVQAAVALDLLVKCIDFGPSKREPDSRRLAERALRAWDPEHSIETRRLNGQSVHPFYWAGFVAAGDWR